MAFKIIETLVPAPVAKGATEEMVLMRDGIALATDIYLPEGATKHSAILVRTPYDKSSRYTALKYEADYYCARGYAVVAQDVRGKFRSEGQTVPYAFDVADGYDTVEWIAQQPWSNGNVGVTGGSYYGFTAWAAVASGHPAIKAAVPQVTGIEMGDGHIGGRWHLDVPSLISLNDLLQIWTDNKGYLAEIDWSAGIEKVFEAARDAVGECVSADEKSQRAAAEDWYNPYGARHPYHTTQIPILHWQNWYDPGLAPSGMKDWRYFRSLAGHRNLHYLHVGSADHAGFKLENVGKGDEFNPYIDERALAEKIEAECGEVADFFDEHLNGVVPCKPRPRARWHAGNVGWQTSEEYPPPSTPVTFYLAHTDEQIGALSRVAPTTSARATWKHDPDHPVPSTTEIEEVWYLLAAYPDEREIAERRDVLTFRSEPLAEPVDFAGRPVLTVSVEFSSPSTHLFAKLQDVHPDGTTRPISWGRVVLTKAIGGTVRLALDDNAYRLAEGHSLQLQIQSSDFPYYAVHPGTDECPWFATRRVISEHSIAIGGIAGAHLELPTVSFSNAAGLFR
ncbi:CocE/NonD family hydrolase [Mycobacterium sp. 360MFTsu5.1]|uniref:CocE/NonD family hydrolase n=1 Tax=Mycobacterium sp. 360MFTsu5.1 TaxID=1172186 RepID=UPI000399E3F1|nr:CocE/NonD family hydrolase [Mycobacterium sp. 360MFTsu5.1]